MDFINSLTTPEQDKPEEPPKEVGILDRITSAIGGQKEEEPPKEVGFLDKIHGAIGGGPQSEKKEDGLDKGA